MIHAMTIDVEDYHSVFGRDWLERDGAPTDAVVRNTRRMLGWLAERDVRCTCFVLGEVAEAFPDLIREIAAGGHELGVHGYYHRQVFKLNPDSFRREVADAKALIEDIAGSPVSGHRAPAFSIMPETSWALEVLADVGFEYDSSIYPIKGSRYGWPGFPLDIHEMQLEGGRRIIEAPLSTVSVFGRRFPSCGGGYLRHFPGFVTQYAISQVARLRPAIVYLHPYEVETDCPPIQMSHLSADRQLTVMKFHKLQLRNRSRVEGKVRALLRRFSFAPLRDVISDVLAHAGSRDTQSSQQQRARA